MASSGALHARVRVISSSVKVTQPEARVESIQDAGRDRPAITANPAGAQVSAQSRSERPMARELLAVLARLRLRAWRTTRQVRVNNTKTMPEVARGMAWSRLAR